MGTVPDRTAASTGIRRSAVRDGSPGLLPPSPRRPAGALSCVWAQTARRYGSDASLFPGPGLRRGRRASGLTANTPTEAVCLDGMFDADGNRPLTVSAQPRG